MLCVLGGVLAVLGIFTLVLSIPAFIVCRMGMKEAAEFGERGSDIARAGKIISIVMMVILAIIIVLTIAAHGLLFSAVFRHIF